MMASSAARCSSRWLTVVVSSGRRAAAGAAVRAGGAGVRGVCTPAAGGLWRGGGRTCGGAGRAVTLGRVSGEGCVSHMVARLGYMCSSLWFVRVTQEESNVVRLTWEGARASGKDEMSL